MYCSSCGKQVVTGLTFCNHCGFRLNAGSGKEIKKPDISANALISAIVSIFVIGFGCIVAILAIMKNLGFDDPFTGLVVMLSFVTILALEGLFMWLLFKRRPDNSQPDETTPKGTAVKELYGAPHKLFAEPSPLDAVPSVTEHTTRTLEHEPR